MNDSTFLSRITMLSLLAACLTFGSSPAAIGQTTPRSHWSQFRGIGNGEAAASAKPPTQWDEQQTAWEVNIPGTGWSSPVYQSKRIWMTTAVTVPLSEEEIAKKLAGDPKANIKTIAASVDLHAICVDLETGQLIHNIKLATVGDPLPINPLNSYASPTPARSPTAKSSVTLETMGLGVSTKKRVSQFGTNNSWLITASAPEARPSFSKTK